MKANNATKEITYASELIELEKQLKKNANRIRGAFSFKKISTLKDYLEQQGIDTKPYFLFELQQPLNIQALNEYLIDESISARVKLWLRYNAPEHDNNSVETQRQDRSDVASLDVKHHEDKEESDDNDYGLPPRANSKVNLFWFQRKACADLLHKIEKDKRRGSLLVSATGSGKTYIIGEMLKRLVDNGFTKQSYSPWPIVWVTKASIVEQTKRVLKNEFDLNIINQVMVINIDQLRSSFGELYIQEKITVVNGEEHISYHWRPIIHPILFILDECQSAKNADSTQSKIIQALAEIQEQIYIVFVSATPFTRVSEAKAWVINCKVPIKE